jgi:hygromycin-B 4-O-kinase
MSKAKTQIDREVVRRFLSERFGATDDSLESIADGETSQAFFFNTQSGRKVLRVNSLRKHGFLKDAYAAKHFSSKTLPIPNVLEIGELTKGVFFVVSERASGKTLDKLNKEDTWRLMPKIIEVLDEIHATPPTGKGYGSWEPNGKGESNSWRDEIGHSQPRRNDELLSSIDLYDHDFHERLQNQIATLLDYCPEERTLVHADFGFDNVVSDGDNITGVIDWEHSMYGDPLYDEAWLSFWGEHQGYEEEFRKHYTSQGRLPKNYDERVLCYKLLIGQTTMTFFARSQQPEKYEATKQILARIKR